MTLREQIERAFSDVEYPANAPITSHECPECDEIAEYFRGASWRGHSLELLCYHRAALSLFSPPAFHYFLPAFMLASLEDIEAADLIPHSIVFDFTPPAEADRRSRFQEHLALFTREQREGIIVFFRYLAEIGEFTDYYVQPAIRALSSHEGDA